VHVFVTGGTGQTGPAIVAELVGSGYTVTGLARSDASAARLEALCATPFRGSMDDLDRLQAGASQADGVVHMAFGGSFNDPQEMSRREVAAIQALGEGLVGTGKPLVTTSGTLVLPAGQVRIEHDTADPNSAAWLRYPGEQACLGLAQRGVRAVVVRLAPAVHGPRDVGFIPMLIATARATRVSAYVEDGSNRWPAVHRLDAANLYRLALEKAPPAKRCTPPARTPSRSRASQRRSARSWASRSGRSPPRAQENTLATRSWPWCSVPTRLHPVSTRSSCLVGHLITARCSTTSSKATTSTHKPQTSGSSWSP